MGLVIIHSSTITTPVSIQHFVDYLLNPQKIKNKNKKIQKNPSTIANRQNSLRRGEWPGKLPNQYR
jgi:hypothetical protein